MVKKETSFIDFRIRNGCFTMRCPESERAM